MTCKDGSFSKIIDYGVILDSEPRQDACRQSTLEKKDCNSFINDTNIEAAFTSTCIGTNDCFLTDVSQFINKGAPADCYLGDSKFFVQAACTYSPKELSKHRMEGLIISCMSVFMALFFICYVDYVKSKAKNDAVEWDIKLITAGDYTVELEIPQAMYDKFVSDIYDPDFGQSKATSFRNYLKKEIQRRLSAFPNLGYEEGVTDVRVA